MEVFGYGVAGCWHVPLKDLWYIMSFISKRHRKSVMGMVQTFRLFLR